MAASTAHLSLLSKSSPSSPSLAHALFTLPKTKSVSANCRFRCSAGQTGFFTRLGRLLKEKAKSDVDKIFSGFSKTRDNLAVIDELLLYWNLADTDKVLDELEEVYLFTLSSCRLLFPYKLIRLCFFLGKQKTSWLSQIKLCYFDLFFSSYILMFEVMIGYHQIISGSTGV